MIRDINILKKYKENDLKVSIAPLLSSISPEKVERFFTALRDSKSLDEDLLKILKNEPKLFITSTLTSFILKDYLKKSDFMYFTINELESYFKADKVAEVMSNLKGLLEEFSSGIDMDSIKIQTKNGKEGIGLSINASVLNETLSNKTIKDFLLTFVNFNVSTSLLEKVTPYVDKTSINDLAKMCLKSYAFNQENNNNNNKKEEVFDFCDILASFRYIKLNKVKNYSDWLEFINVYQTYTDGLHEAMNGAVDSISKSLYKCNKENNELTKKLEESEEKVKLLSEKIKKEIKRQSKLSDTQDTTLKELRDLKKDLFNEFKVAYAKKEKESILSITKDVKYSTLEATYKSQVSNLTESLSDRIAENKALKNEKNLLTKELDILTKKNEELLKRLSLTDCEHDNGNDIKEIATTTINDVKEKNDIYNYAFIFFSSKPSSGIDTISYELYYPNNGKIEYISLNKDIKILNNQVILTKNNKFYKPLDYYAAQNVLDKTKGVSGCTICRFYQEGRESYAIDINDTKYSMNHLNDSNKLSENHLIITKDGVMKAVLKRIKDDIFLFKDYYNARKERVLVILDKISNGLIVRDCFSDVQSFIETSSINENNFSISKKDIITINSSNKITSKLPLEEYTGSPHYKYKSIVSYENGIGRKSTGEVVVIDISDMLELNVKNGEVIAIDEFNIPLYYSTFETEAPTRSLSARRKPNNSTGVSESDVLSAKRKVIILGNIAYKNSYTLSFIKENVHAVVIDGFLSYSRVFQTINKEKPHKIIIDCSFVSHDNMWNIKEDFKSSYITASSSGASSMVNDYLDNI